MILIFLAVWRISQMLADDSQSGPFGVLDKLRYATGVRYDKQANMIMKPGSLADLITCIYCNSIWVGLIFAIIYWISPTVAIGISFPFALSAGAVLINQMADLLERIKT